MNATIKSLAALAFFTVLSSACLAQGWDEVNPPNNGNSYGPPYSVGADYIKGMYDPNLSGGSVTMIAKTSDGLTYTGKFSGSVLINGGGSSVTISGKFVFDGAQPPYGTQATITFNAVPARDDGKTTAVTKTTLTAKP